MSVTTTRKRGITNEYRKYNKKGVKDLILTKIKSRKDHNVKKRYKAPLLYSHILHLLQAIVMKVNNQG